MLPLLFIAACSRSPAPLTEQEKHNVSQLTQNLETYCIGRYLIDMPADMLVSGGATVQGVEIDSDAMSHEAYRQEIASRRAELKKQKSIDAYPLLYVDDEVDGPDTHYFVHRGNVSDDPGNRIFEAYKWDHGYRFKLGIVGSDFLHPDQTQDPIVKQIGIYNDVPQKTHLIFDLIKRLRWRDKNEIPAEPGICFPGAFLPGKAGDKEEVGAQFVFNNNRDVNLGFSSNSEIREADTLLQRGGQIAAALRSIKGGRSIRKGAVELQGIHAEEWLISGETALRVPGNIFTLEANSMTSGPQSPLLTLDMSTGSPNGVMHDQIKAASMSEGEAVALWDVISRTLRPRPNGF
ncbi:T6SS immunity protein Tli4 family protein [Burkholderia sp. 22PA0106]|uniref:T6SS immunity protein Tli4 family protein n=1 Tax=Burkholderia sp. 22PA0106 TaxID=3237371 RepID=UPI0039C0DEA1